MKTSGEDPWQMILQSLNPDYKILKNAMEIEPRVKIKLYKNKNKWTITLEEFWPDKLDIVMGTKKLDDTVEWCIKILQTWQNCRRTSWDTWEFGTKKNAEKFITYYNIACPQ